MTTPLKIESETRFTPGPWEVSEGKDNVGERDGVWGSVRGGGYYLARIWNDASGIDAEANALLIAAGPQMYKALKAVEEANQIGSWGPAMNKVRAALAKAVKP